MEFIAHVRGGEERPALAAHLLGVAEIASRLAAKIGLARLGELMGFERRGELEVVILLAGGDKSSQAKDIARALELARGL